ncbi:hypothetical protein DH2020_005933 [Rehmannia glutinosa]|uniref:non-specific serine/threonine protein kinase n=1 Tax=Rehmannia glutinosa TaxID=99300 RepID=A0ABR0XHP8_REHGL
MICATNLIMLNVSHDEQLHCEFSAMDFMHPIALQCQALVSFRTTIVSSDGILLQWRPEDEDPCGWKGVKCDFKSKRVTALSLPNHKLSGPISPEIGKLESLQFLYALSFELFFHFLIIPPAADAKFKYLLVELFMTTTYLGQSLQNSGTGNFLSGWIPSELGTSLSWKISWACTYKSFALLNELHRDLSSNSLSGSIPASLGKLSKLSRFNVSTNFLVGPIPSDGALASFQNDSFVGNRELCGKQTQICKNNGGGSSAFSQPTDSGQAKKKYSGRLLISALATVGALLLVALMCFWGCYLYKRLGKNDGKGLAVDVSGGASIVMFHGDLPYSSKDIIKKLENLNEEHVIGAGGFGTVYKLAMDDGNIFALKRIVKRSEQLDWEARLNIIMGAAKGLAYLHHDCSPRIIHRDIKSSNILLDGNFDARVSDFGLAKLLEDEESHITTIVAGTFGYLAPAEYMQSGRATEKTDVYSFGVLVLEIVSGKRPTDASFIEKGLNIVGWGLENLSPLASYNGYHLARTSPL